MSQNKLTENKMGTMPIGRLLLNMATPMIIAMIVQGLYNIVDSIYVARISESAVTALSLAFPVQNMQIGCALGVGVGVNALLSRALGERDGQLANKAAGNGFILMLITVAAFMIFGFFGVRAYYEMQSNVTETVEGGIIYTRICCILTLGIFVEILGERLLQSTGRTFFTLISQGMGAVINIVLDPVFIFGVEWLNIPAMGIAGAAVATVIGQSIGAILVVIFNLKYNPEIKFGLCYLKPDASVIRDILMVGIPTAVMNGIGSVMTFGMNQILQGFQETATGVFGVYFKLQSFFFMPLFGINNATISIIAYNYGSRQPKRIMTTLRIALVAALTIMISGWVAFQLVPDLLLSMFNPSEDFMNIGCAALREISWAFPMAAFGIIASGAFQALGNGIYSTIVSMCRQLLVLLPSAYLLSLSGQVNNVWWSFLIAEFASVAVSAFLMMRIYRQKIKPLYTP